MLVVTKRDGRRESFIADKINKVVIRACEGLDNVYPTDIVLDAELNIYNGITTKELDKALVLSAKSKIEQDPNYSYVAARLLLNSIYKEVFSCSINQNEFHDSYREVFISNIYYLVDKGLFKKELLEFDLEYLSDMLVPTRDTKFKYFGLATVYDRYLYRYQDELLETPQAWLMRVAMGLALNEGRDKTQWALRFYEAISQFKFMPSTPTLFNSGTRYGQLSSCFLSTISDSLHGIMGEMHTQAQLSKYAGGLGVDITPIRAMGSTIESSGGKAAGVVKYAKIFNDTVVAFDQGGRRPGAGCLYLELTHPDIRTFIKIRRNTGDERLLCHDTSLAIWVPSDFYRRVEEGKDWYFICPSEAPDLHELYAEAFDKRYAEYIEMCEAGKIKNWSKMPAKALEKEFLIQALETGYPFVGFKDAINVQYPNAHVGVVKSSNLCTEICEHTVASEYDERGHKTKIGETAVCTLSSHNLNETSEEEREYICYLQVRAGDNAITLNRYTTDESEKGSLTHRYIGVGNMGFQDVLYKKGIPYDSPEAVILADEIQEELSYYIIKASISLAKERGTYSTYEGSSWSKGLFPHDLHAKYADYMGKDIKITKRKNWDSLKSKLLEYGIRNSNCIAIAPNATIADICGCFPSIDPCYSVLHTRETLSGQFVYPNEYFVTDMKNENLWTDEMVNELKKYEGDVLRLNIPDKYKKLYRRVFDLDFFKVIDCAAERTKWIDQSQSFNLYNNKKSMKYAHDLYVYCWNKLLKTVYYMRSESASKMEKVTTTQISDSVACSVDNPDCESCQ